MKYITVVKGVLKEENTEANKLAHDTIFEPLRKLGVSLSAIGHTAYLDPKNPKQFLAIDTWTSLDGPKKLFSDPQVALEFEKLFDGMPEVTFWEEPGWASFYNG